MPLQNGMACFTSLLSQTSGKHFVFARVELFHNWDIPPDATPRVETQGQNE